MDAGLIPCASRFALVIKSMINCTQTTRAKAIAGRIANGIVTFDKHGGEVRNRQRLPEENAPIATFAVQRVKAIEHADDEHDKDHHHRRHIVRISIAARCFTGSSSNNTPRLRSAKPIVLIARPNT